MIPRQVLFGNPEKSMARISPDGEYLSYLAPVAGVLNVWIAEVEDPDSARPITRDEERDIRDYTWTYDGQHILYYQDARGDENWHVYATNIATGETRDLTPFEKVNSQILSVNEKTPNEILVGLTFTPDTYVLYPDEGHGFARPENRLSFYAVAEAFLSEHLGGRFEPVGEDFQGSKIRVPEGADQVPGLQTALVQ